MNDKLLYTGASGFLGYNTLPQLRERYDVTTLGPTERDMIRCDLATTVPPLSERYDVVLHAAGKAHIIPRTEEERRSFYEVNEAPMRGVRASRRAACVHLHQYRCCIWFGSGGRDWRRASAKRRNALCRQQNRGRTFSGGMVRKASSRADDSKAVFIGRNACDRQFGRYDKRHSQGFLPKYR